MQLSTDNTEDMLVSFTGRQPTTAIMQFSLSKYVDLNKLIACVVESGEIIMNLLVKCWEDDDVTGKKEAFRPAWMPVGHRGHHLAENLFTDIYDMYFHYPNAFVYCLRGRISYHFLSPVFLKLHLL